MEKICKNCENGRMIVGSINASEEWKEKHRLCYRKNIYVHIEDECNGIRLIEEEEEE